MEKLDKPYTRAGKKITHRVVCGKVRKMRGGRDLVAEDFEKREDDGDFRIDRSIGIEPYIFFGDTIYLGCNSYNYAIFCEKWFGGKVVIRTVGNLKLNHYKVEDKYFITLLKKLKEYLDKFNGFRRIKAYLNKIISNYKPNNVNPIIKKQEKEENEENEENQRRSEEENLRKKTTKPKNNLNTELTVNDFSKNGYIGGFEVKKIGHKYYFFIGQGDNTYSLVIISYMENGEEQIQIKMLDGDEIIDVEFNRFAEILNRISIEKDNFNFRKVPDKMLGLTLILKKFYDNMSFHPTKKEEFNNNKEHTTSKHINPNKILSSGLSYYDAFHMLLPYEFIQKFILNRRDKLLEHHRAVAANKIAKKFVHDNLFQLIRNNNSNKKLVIDEFLENINIKQKFKLNTEINMLMSETEEEAIENCKHLVMREISILSNKNSLNQIQKQIRHNEITGMERLM